MNNTQQGARSLTEQPQKFTFDSSANSTGSITLKWNYNDILMKDNNGNNMKLSNTASPDIKYGMIPFIDKLR